MQAASPNYDSSKTAWPGLRLTICKAATRMHDVQVAAIKSLCESDGLNLKGQMVYQSKWSMHTYILRPYIHRYTDRETDRSIDR